MLLEYVGWGARYWRGWRGEALEGTERRGIGGDGGARHWRGQRGEALEGTEGRGIGGDRGSRHWRGQRGEALEGVEGRGVGGAERPDVGGIAVKHGFADWESQRL